MQSETNLLSLEMQSVTYIICTHTRMGRITHLIRIVKFSFEQLSTVVRCVVDITYNHVRF